MHINRCRDREKGRAKRPGWKRCGRKGIEGVRCWAAMFGADISGNTWCQHAVQMMRMRRDILTRTKARSCIGQIANRSTLIRASSTRNRITFSDSGSGCIERRRRTYTRKYLRIRQKQVPVQRERDTGMTFPPCSGFFLGPL
jgi:hypothetical protein